ncbi:hypothetical protein [Streptomyces scopuliridis]|uniref:Uncharacterized protein n=1 Tax=Streptomyces scopuliridis TaxID=452529 RepID=A0ACD4ZPH6_9ACTN|nr:hypothetical protein [Streptomyces scopuliridis]WSC00081.1 hypothetical protein OG835_25850 [Streptomyces scopuliridis]
MSTEPDEDERRIAQQLRQRIDGPTADQAEAGDPDDDAPPPPNYAPDVDPTEDDWVDKAVAQSRGRVVIPTRVIPSGTPLPDRAPEPDEAPPWRPAPAPASSPPAVPPPLPPHGWYGPGPYAPPPPPDPGPIEVYVTVLPAPLPPEPTRRERLTAWLRTVATPLQATAGLVLAVAPILPRGYSCAGTWYSTVGQAREFGTGWGYAIGGGALLLAGFALVRKSEQRPAGRGSSFVRVWALAVTAVGVLGAIHPYDPVTWITGVHL